MLEVRFYDRVEDERLRFAVIVSQYNGQWVFSQHKKRDTLECPGGHREPGETVENTARRELYEETGALEFDLRPAGVYAVVDDAGTETCGMLYAARIHTLGALPESEIERVVLTSRLPETSVWTYPLIQPRLVERVVGMGLL